ncbi:ABC transporter substrate-binding protein [Paracoccus aminophilus]|uniref:ABC cobalamin/Fe3+-siderophore transporter, periplasmic substrate-binding subunit n=1 Tax=Paracoccus aminophilus JCM 7686 TaxID=1367847 RepID=S5XUC6_PARAH|nr:ABC transporter substrate-binding protein [Paracoccus aminophilus]AGT11079.1 ABC cobalamin/Fe3+-siderophore transporter, periplasmic substrate-binding subunit [Paracoccus aminophilus JCM 7686]
MPRLGRRLFLQAAAVSVLAPSLIAPKAFAAPAPPPKGGIIALDWALAANALALGADVTGVPSTAYYNRATVEPALRPDTVDVGLLFTPNFEFIDELSPRLILIPPRLGQMLPFLRRIAPVEVVDLASNGTATLDAATAALIQIGTLTGRDPQPVIAEAETTLTEAAAALARHRGKPFLLLTLADDRHLSVFTAESFEGQVMARLGLVNDWTRGAFFGSRATVALDELAQHPEASLLVLDAAALNGLSGSSPGGLFWEALPAVREHRTRLLPALLEDGGLPSAIRLARLLAETLA